jgi:hypothetical protein
MFISFLPYAALPINLAQDLISNRGTASSNPEMNTYNPSENTALSILLGEDEQYSVKAI